MGILALIQKTQWVGHLLPMVLYVGPDVFLPIASALAAIGGVLLMFWQRVVALFSRLFRRQTKESGTPPAKAHSDVQPD